MRERFCTKVAKAVLTLPLVVAIAVFFTISAAASEAEDGRRDEDGSL